MSELKNKIMPLVYILILCLAAYIVYRTFSYGLRQGEFTGKYNPPVDTLAAGAKPRETVYLVNLLQPTPGLLAEGKRLFQLNCVSCHGADGKGDGPKAAGLNPPPRNYVEGKFKNGTGSLQIYNTISTGLSGSSMASFSFLSEKERMSLAHYVRTFIPHPEDNPQALIDQLPKPPGAAVATAAAAPAAKTDTSKAKGAADTTKAKTAAPAAPSIKLPLDFAERRILEEAAASGAGEVLPGGRLESQVYVASCARCHGKSGEGLEVAGGNATTGALYYRPRPLSQARAEILESPAALGRFLSEGIAGFPGHRFADLSRTQVDELYKALGGKSDK